MDDARLDAVTGSRRAVAVVFAIVFLDLVGFGIIIPILPFYVRSFGVSDLFIGLLAASYSLAQFVVAPVLGRVSDERGRRPVMLITTGVGGIAWLGFGLAGEIAAVSGTTAGVVAMFGARLLAGAAGGNIATAQAYIADVTPPKRRAEGLGLIGAAFGLGFIFGPAIGGLMASDAVLTVARETLPAAIPVTRFSLPSFTAGGFSFVALGAAALVLREPDRPRGQGSRVTFVAQFRDALADRTLRPLVVAFFLTSVAFAAIQVMFIPFVADFFGYDATEAALLLTYIGVLGTVNQGLLVGRLARRFGAARIALAGAVSLFAALVLLAASPVVGSLLPAGGPGWLTGGLVVLLAFGALASFGNGSLTVGLSTLVSAGAPAASQGRAFGVTQGASSLGRTIGPPLAAAGYVVVYWSPFVAGALVLLPVAASLWMRGLTPLERS